MATAAPTTGAPSGEPVFKINGTTPGLDTEAYQYVAAAHAVACLGYGNGRDEGQLYSSDSIILAGFDAIELLLAHAAGILEAGHR